MADDTLSGASQEQTANRRHPTRAHDREVGVAGHRRAEDFGSCVAPPHFRDGGDAMRLEHVEGAREGAIHLFPNSAWERRNVQWVLRAIKIPDRGWKVDHVHEPDSRPIRMHEPRETLNRAGALRRPVNRQQRPEWVALRGPPPPDDQDVGVGERLHLLRGGAYEKTSFLGTAGSEHNEVDLPLPRRPEDLGRGMSLFVAGPLRASSPTGGRARPTVPARLSGLVPVRQSRRTPPPRGREATTRSRGTRKPRSPHPPRGNTRTSAVSPSRLQEPHRRQQPAALS